MKSLPVLPVLLVLVAVCTVPEFGVAQLRGKTAKQRAEALIGIAHPDFRGELREAAKKMQLL